MGQTNYCELPVVQGLNGKLAVVWADMYAHPAQYSALDLGARSVGKSPLRLSTVAHHVIFDWLKWSGRRLDLVFGNGRVTLNVSFSRHLTDYSCLVLSKSPDWGM